MVLVAVVVTRSDTAAESRSEASSALRASLMNMAVAIGRLLEHKTHKFSYGREAVLTRALYYVIAVLADPILTDITVFSLSLTTRHSWSKLRSALAAQPSAL